MPGMQFEYDEHGGTFYYFLLSFIALILIPATYYLWPRKGAKGDCDSTACSIPCGVHVTVSCETLTPVAYMQNRVPYSQRYLVNAKPGTNHSTNPTNPNGNSKR